jgi:hypothetical protein
VKGSSSGRGSPTAAAASASIDSNGGNNGQSSNGQTAAGVSPRTPGGGFLSRYYTCSSVT